MCCHLSNDGTTNFSVIDRLVWIWQPFEYHVFRDFR
ncbi:unnamed protein product [Acanthoscelides obtectus]|uniref:Uncharacterized protein n=1 Tax=Acanthoscelides obtectus TaxID=200917 RepID=A0A9P0L1T2_ACAOB|nr:unnamed protein product [Acanthoscelides obtectus]CAK1660207.1 hypothetical protein AOBTE_LOCUS21908 [Acanthoscelides obtectus]